ncbi:nitrite transporter NirC [Oerskovia enterophila]
MERADHRRVLTLTENLSEQSRAARTKVEGTRHPWRYLVAAMLAGAYIGVGVVLMVATAGPFLAAGAPAERLVAGGVFSVALTLVVFAGAELSTSAMMILTQGAVTRTIPVRSAVGTLLFCFGGNLLGSMLFGWMVVQSGILHTNAAAGEMIASMLAGKSHETGGQLFFRGVLCNVLVCAAIWACGRLRSEAGKAIVIFWAIFAFISSGFEHVVANMTTFSIGLFSPEMMTTWGQFGRNLLFVGLGNLVGGAVVVGLGYAAVAGRRQAGEPEAGAVSGLLHGVDEAAESEPAPRVEGSVRLTERTPHEV